MRQRARTRRPTRRSAGAVAAAVLSAGLVLGGLAPALAVPSPAPDASPSTSATPEPTTSAPAPEATESADGGSFEQAPMPQLRATQGLATMQIVAPAATIVVNARVLRKESNPQDLNNSAYLEGLTYRLYRISNNRPGTATDYSCTIAAAPATTCTIGIPAAGVGQAYFVVQEANAATYNNEILMLGSYSGPQTQFFYAGRTPSISSGNNIQFPQSSTDSSGNYTRSSVLAASLRNPGISLTCQEGLRIAIQMDLSDSVSDSQRLQYRNALNNLVDSLAGTGTQIALFTFGQSSPVKAGWEKPTPRNVNTDAAAIKADITTFTGDPGGTQTTNWDLALRSMATANAGLTEKYDMALFLTDGAPNYISNSTGNGGTAVSSYNVTTKSIEQAIFSANQLKHQGTRVVAVGIGAGASGDVARNIAAVSGPTKGSDYFQGDWDALETSIKNIVNSAICRVPVTVKKETLNAQNQWALTNDWAMTLNASASVGTATRNGAATQNTSGTSGSAPLGAANWTIDFSRADAKGAITVSESFAGKTGFGWQSGSYVVYHQDGTQTTGTLTGPTDQKVTGLAVTDRVEMTFRNASTAKVSATKVWVVKDSSGAVVGTYNLPKTAPSAPDVPAGLTATPILGTIANPAWGTEYSGYAQGSELVVSEKASVDAALLPGCVLTSSQVTKVNGQSSSQAVPYTATLGGGANTFELTNTVTCTQTLNLVKVVAAPGTEKTSAWTLEATAPSGALAGPKGSYSAGTPVTAKVTADKAYALKESGGPATYVPASAGWQCVLTGTTTAVPLTSGSVKVGLGKDVTCTITNVTAKLTLLKKTADGSGLVPADFTLTGTPASGFTLATLQTPGANTANAGNTFEVRPAHTYTLAETTSDGTIAYRNLALQKLKPGTDPAVDANWENVGSADVQVAAGESAVYRFVNDKVPAVVLPLTGGAASDAYLLLGGAIVSAIVAVAAWRAARRMKRGAA